MLVLSRQIQEQIEIKDRTTGKHIARIVVCDIDRNKVRLGFDAPDDIVIYRKELEEHFKEPECPS